MHRLRSADFVEADRKSVSLFFFGDFNDFKTDTLISQSPQFRQMITYPTCGNNCLEKVVTDLHVMYQPPLKIESLIPNSPGLGV